MQYKYSWKSNKKSHWKNENDWLHIYVYVYIHIYTCIYIYMYTYMYTYFHEYICIWIYTYKDIGARSNKGSHWKSENRCIYVHTHIHIRICIHAYIYIYMYVHECTPIHICMFVCISKYTNMNTGARKTKVVCAKI